MTTRSTSGIVLTISPYGEADKLVTFFSPQLGLVTGIAKGARRSKHRFVNKLEEFSLLRILYRPSRTGGLLFLSEAELDNAFLSLRTDYDRYVTAMFIAELVLRFSREHDPDPETFALLHWALRSLDTGRAPTRIAALFHLRLLDSAGYRPELDSCSVCHCSVSSARSFTLNPASGSLTCNSCHRHTGKGSNHCLSVQTIKFLQQAQQLDLHLLNRLRLPDRSAAETLAVLDLYTRYLLQQDIHSRRFLPRVPAPGS